MTTTTGQLRYAYKLHGLVFASEIELPELAGRPASTAVPADVRIRLGEVEPPATAPELKAVATPNGAFFLGVPKVARFLVRRDGDVIVDPLDDGFRDDLGEVRGFLLGWIVTLVCTQRNFLALHASAVAFGDRVVAFMGDQGAGKSTLAAHCVQVGAKLVADDLLRVELADSGPPRAHPGMPLLKLWRQTLEGMGRDANELAPAWWHDHKFLVPFSGELVENALPIACIHVLEQDETAGAGRFEPLAAAAAVSALVANSHDIYVLDAIGRRPGHLDDCVRLAGNVEIVRLARRHDAAQLPATARYLERRLSVG
jgi:hypothetical protein